MKELDFLPRAYRNAIVRRMHTRRNVLLTAGLVLAMAGLHYLNATRIQSAEASLNQLQNGQCGWQSVRAQMAALQAEKLRARRQLDLINRLEDAAPLDAAIGEIAGLLSESMAMRGLFVETVESTPEPAPAAVQPAPTGQAALPPVTRARMTGLATNDVEVGIFLSKLSSCPLFSDVSLSFSREWRGAGRRMREFEVKFTIRPVEATR